jgi:alanyl-tRNA synthetase
MTEKLYYSNPYITTWTTTIKDVYNNNGCFIVTLEQTAFYPEGGGQPSDHGTINGIQVLDVFEKKDEVYHKINERPSTDVVDCKIDWHRRFDHMQHHSGQHLLSAVCLELFNIPTVSFHLGKENVTIDLETPSLIDEQLHAIETVANQYIYENKKINTFILHNKEELLALPIRKIPDIEENIRIVEITEVDVSACCGTHVKRTGEIGILKILKTEKHRGNTRLYFKCGMRALNEYQFYHKNISVMSKRLDSHPDDLVDKIIKIEQSNRDLQKKLLDEQQENFRHLAKEIIAKHENFVLEFFSKRTIKELQQLARLILDQSNLFIAFASLLENRLLLTHDGKFSFDCGKFIQEYGTKYNCKGGGNKTMAQAVFENEKDLTLFVSFLKEYMENHLLL